MDIFIKETGEVKTLDLYDPETGRKYYNGFVESRLGLSGKYAPKVEVWIAAESDYKQWRDLVHDEQYVMNMSHKHYDDLPASVKEDLIEVRDQPINHSVSQAREIIERVLYGSITDVVQDSLSVKYLNEDAKGVDIVCSGDFTIKTEDDSTDVAFKAQSHAYYDRDENVITASEERWSFSISLSVVQEKKVLAALYGHITKDLIQRGFIDIDKGVVVRVKHRNPLTPSQPKA